MLHFINQCKEEKDVPIAYTPSPKGEKKNFLSPIQFSVFLKQLFVMLQHQVHYKSRIPVICPNCTVRKFKGFSKGQTRSKSSR